MVRQWFPLRRKKYSRCHHHHRHQYHQHPPPLDRFVIYRTNPIYVDDGFLIDAPPGSPPAPSRCPQSETRSKLVPLSILAPHDPKLHVDAWCSLVCPRHLTTCCACKPQWIYCDACHPPPPSHHHHKRAPPASPHQSQPPDLLLPFQSSSFPLIASYLGYGPIKMKAAEEGGGVFLFSEPLPPEGHRQAQADSRPPSPAPPQPSDRKRNNLQIYLNSNYVRDIRVVPPLHGQLRPRPPPSEGIHPPSTSSQEAILATSSDNDSSLESLRIDERMFADVLLDNDEERGADMGRVPEAIVISPANYSSTDKDSSAYEAVKDLYEKLSNNRQRQALTQATQKNRLLRNYVHNTYETLTNHARGTYAKLVEEEFRRNSSIYLVPNEPGDERAEEGGGRKGQQQPETTGHQQHPEPISSILPMQKQLPTRNREGLNPKPTLTNKGPFLQMVDNLRKRFKQKAYRDACKIIGTTLVGLTAFGIITTLSLSVNRH